MKCCSFVGNGEQGKPFPLTDADRVDQAYRENGFNIYVSDRISLNRSVPDIRHPKWVMCVFGRTPKNLSLYSLIHMFKDKSAESLASLCIWDCTLLACVVKHSKFYYTSCHLISSRVFTEVDFMSQWITWVLFSAVPTGLCWGFLSHLNLPYQSFLLSVRWAPDEKKKRKHFLKFLAKWPVASGKTAIFYKKYISVGVSIFIIEAKMGHQGSAGFHSSQRLQQVILQIGIPSTGEEKKWITCCSPLAGLKTCWFSALCVRYMLCKANIWNQWFR